MYILRSWRDSLSLLAPSNLKLFLLVTLKSTVETYKVLFTRLVPILTILGMVAVTYLLKVVQPYMQYALANGPAAAVVKYGWLYILFLMLQFIFLYLEIYIGYAATRPSIGIKNDAYFLRFWKHYCLLMLVPIGIYITLSSLVLVIPSLQYFIYILLLLTHSLFNIIILFFLDSDGSFTQLWRSIRRAFTMTIYNLPLISILFALETGSVFGYQKLGLYEAWWLASVPFLLSVFLINIYTNFYIKKTHEQPDLYFEAPK